MNRVRAFSDTEIVTIAAVAASALGGIVIGLGRGQDSGSSNRVGSSQLQSVLTRARESGNISIPSISTLDVSIDAEPLRSAIETARQSSVSMAKRATPHVDARAAISAARERVPASRPRPWNSYINQVKALGKQIIASNLSDGPTADWQDLRSESIKKLSQFIGSETPGRESEDATDDGILSRVSDGLVSIEHEVASAPESLRVAKEKSQSAAREHISDPLARVVGSTTDATKESMAALAWLGLGTAVVYFGLLSADRRENVKAALCGVVEQARLLMLDLEGYEPEM